MITNNYSVIKMEGLKMSEGVFTVRINRDKKEKLDRLAKQLDRSRNYLVSQAIENLLELHAWQIEQTELALTEADAGDFSTDKEIESLNERYRNP